MHWTTKKTFSAQWNKTEQKRLMISNTHLSRKRTWRYLWKSSQSMASGAEARLLGRWKPRRLQFCSISCRRSGSGPDSEEGRREAPSREAPPVICSRSWGQGKHHHTPSWEHPGPEEQLLPLLASLQVSGMHHKSVEIDRLMHQLVVITCLFLTLSHSNLVGVIKIEEEDPTWLLWSWRRRKAAPNRNT